MEKTTSSSFRSIETIVLFAQAITRAKTASLLCEVHQGGVACPILVLVNYRLFRVRSDFTIV